MPKLQFVNTSAIMHDHVHGYHDKDLVVLHETISPDAPGLKDIWAVERYLADKDYGIHGMTDLEGNIAWTAGLGRAVFWQAGGVNERSVGIEQVSTGDTSGAYWIGRNKELRATAKLLAAIHNTWKIPLVFSDGHTPGVTGHWCVSQWSPASKGHTDVHPRHLGGNYPLLSVIQVARAYAKLGYRL